MQFLLIAMDGAEDDVPAKRQKLRDAHLAGLRRLKQTQNFVIGGALLDEEGEVMGSSIVYDFSDRASLDAAIAADPYTEGGVWDAITVHPFRTAGI